MPVVQRSHHVNGMNMTTKGKPTAMKCRKPTSTPIPDMNCANWVLGAVPIFVPMPPMFAP